MCLEPCSPAFICEPRRRSSRARSQVFPSFFLSFNSPGASNNSVIEYDSAHSLQQLEMPAIHGSLRLLCGLSFGICRTWVSRRKRPEQRRRADANLGLKTGARFGRWLVANHDEGSRVVRTTLPAPATVADSVWLGTAVPSLQWGLEIGIGLAHEQRHAIAYLTGLGRAP